MQTIISVENISKTFLSQSRRRKVKALEDVSLSVYRGEILGILGPNGAGKTTLLNILATLLLPDQGSVTMLGLPLVEKNFPYLRQQFNMSSGSPNLPWSLTVEEILRFYGRLYGLRGEGLKDKVEELIKTFELEQFRGRRFDELSSGSKQRLALAKALLNNPKIIFLDEPTVGLDPDVAIRVRQMVQEVIRKTQATVLFTTHN
ncbi:MAG: ABC transporter ATP-binding protein, partial [Candidatus Omnitrophica bacterium]|nr:ABC transporter ATP-binding protein [Candidatus Omnitrophota bacterium]